MRRLPLGSCTQRMDLEAPWVSSPRVPAWDLGRWQIPQWALKRKLHSGPGKTYSFSHLATGLLWRQGRKWCFTVCPAVCSFLCWRLVECLGDQNSTLSSLCSDPSSWLLQEAILKLSSHQVAKVLEFQLHHHPFQRNPRADLLQDWKVGSF